eukprot:COSAG06_NODE_1908_length_8088_cov_2.473526_6_plen_52_part_00
MDAGAAGRTRFRNRLANDRCVGVATHTQAGCEGELRRARGQGRTLPLEPMS